LPFPSTGEKTLPATYVFLRPLWVFREYPELGLVTPWLDWPEALRRTFDLDSIPQAICWQGWGRGPMEISEIVSLDRHLAGFVHEAPEYWTERCPPD